MIAGQPAPVWGEHPGQPGSWHGGWLACHQGLPHEYLPDAGGPRFAAKGYPIDPADVARLTPLGHPTINLDGRYRTTNRPPATGLRPLRIN